MAGPKNCPHDKQSFKIELSCYNLSCEIYVKSVATLFFGHRSIQVSAFRRLTSVPIVSCRHPCAFRVAFLPFCAILQEVVA